MMRKFFVPAALALTVAACSQGEAPDAPETAAQAPEAQAPAADEPAAPVAGMAADTAIDAAAPPVITVRDGWVRATPAGGDVTAAYFTLDNSGGADRLTGASSGQLDNVELHATTMDENNVMRMGHLHEGAAVPAGGAAVFAPGGNHLMLYGASGLALGYTLCLQLSFERAAPRIACLPVMDGPPLD